MVKGVVFISGAATVAEIAVAARARQANFWENVFMMFTDFLWFTDFTECSECSEFTDNTLGLFTIHYSLFTIHYSPPARRHCERSEAIQQQALDCFASLAMTASG
jgi:hypothetical protein